MRDLIHVDPADAVPIWNQIEREVRRLAASGAVEVGQPVPSVRELARFLRVNPATVSKAYQRLTDEGVLEVRRGEGTFVSRRPKGVVDTERRQLLACEAHRLTRAARTLGADLEALLAVLREAWDQGETK